MNQATELISAKVLEPLVELTTLGRMLKRRTGAILTYFDWSGISNRPPKVIKRRLEHLRDRTLGFQNLANYMARSLLETGGFRSRLHANL